MFQQLQTPCDACGQRGKIIKHKCPACKGQRVLRKPTPVELKVPRGAPQEFRIVYENEADAHPDHLAGDPHPLVLPLANRVPTGAPPSSIVPGGLVV
jgi:DnaJ-related protein SCJ1